MRKQKLNFPTMLMLSSVSAFLALIITPSIPQISLAFKITNSQSTWVISIYLIGYAFGQLIYGPLSNTKGRKKIAITGLMLGIFGNLLAFSAEPLHIFTILIISRFLMAFGLSSGLVTGMLMISDIYKNQKARAYFSSIVLAFSIMPFVAVFVGGQLTEIFGWESLFVFSFIYLIIISLCVVYLLPETNKTTKDIKIQLNLKELVTSYFQIFQNKNTIKLLLIYTFFCLFNLFV